jgi:hypothetical protein
MKARRILKSGAIARVTAGVLAAMIGFGASSALAHEPIVGLWYTIWINNGRAADKGAVILNAFDIWHADYTEAQADSGPVIAGFVCQGAWTSLGNHTYFLSHPNFNYVPPDGHLDTTTSAVTYLKVTLSKDGNSFHGNGVIKTYTGINPFDPSAAVTFALPIKITAKRVVPDPSQLH